MSIETGPGPEFIKDRYWGREEFRDVVDRSVEKQKRLSPDGGFGVPQRPAEKIPYYLERLERIAGKTNQRTGERGRLFLEMSIFPNYITKPENISDGYIKEILLGNFAELRGYERGDLEQEEIWQSIEAQFQQETGQDFEHYKIPEQERDRVAGMVIEDQRTRLEQWFDYLTSEEAKNAPASFRYWAFAELLKLGSYDKSRKTFNKRSETTAATFPELNQQALALVFDEIARSRLKEPSHLILGDEESQTRFRELLTSENFGRLYAFALEHVNSLRMPLERLPITKGQWRLFAKESSPHELTSTLVGFNTAWCIAGDGYARDYLSASDVWIYFSEDIDGKSTIPRACIVQNQEHGITEVRGIMSDENAKQHLDDYITPVVEEKLMAMPGGEQWQTTMEDMKKLARIHLKHVQGEQLDKAELIFIYEIDGSIKSSGYQKDPRITEIRSQRDPKADAPFVFGCQPQEIAWGQDQITEQTKAYIGPLFPGIFTQLKHLEYIAASFPEGTIRRGERQTTGKTGIELKQILENKGVKFTENSKFMIQSSEFIVSPAGENITTIRLKVHDLFPDGRVHSYDEIVARAGELGLDLLPHEIGADLLSDEKDQPSLGEWYTVATKTIADRSGRPDVFNLLRHDDGLWLIDYWANPDGRWYPDHKFVFRLRQVSSET